MILYPKVNSMLLNTFLILFRHENHFCALSVTGNQNFSGKSRKNESKFDVIFGEVFAKKFDFLSLRERKNDFHTEITLETCSATLTYPYDTIS